MIDPLLEAATRRVVITAVRPTVAPGAYPLKRVAGDQIDLEAHVIADSHDIIAAALETRRLGASDWTHHRLERHPNDEFRGAWTPEAIGLYEYRVAGWIDHFTSWRNGFLKKLREGQDMRVELLIGAELTRAAADRAADDDAVRLEAWAEFLADAGRDYGQRVRLIEEHDLSDLAFHYQDRLAEAVSPTYLLSLERELAISSAWYEFFPRSAAGDGKTHGTFADAATLFPEIARMGFDIVYFPPIHPIGRVHRKGKNNTLTPGPDDVGSPWAIGAAEGGHKSILPELGTLEDFRAMRKEAETHGLEVALDIAFQCAPDHPYVKQHPEWFNWRPDGTVQYAENPPKKYQDILPFNYETADWKALWEELRSVFVFWIEQGVKVFRVDNPHTKSFPFWHWCLLSLKKDYPETIYLSEAFTRPKRKYELARTGFTQGYTYFTWRNFPSELRSYVEELTQTPVNDFFWPNFWPNTPDILHDDLQHGTRATFVGRYLLAATLSSNHGIYGPAFEVLDREPFPGKEEYNNNEKYQLKAWNWNALGNLKPEITRINAARKAHPALQRTSNITFVETDNEHLLAYVKMNWDRRDLILVVVNMDWQWTQTGWLELPLAQMGLGPDKAFTVTDLLDPVRPSYQWRGSRNFVKLEPLKAPGHLFTVTV